MAYQILKEEIYDRAFFIFYKNDKKINIVFEPIAVDEYLVIGFCEDGSAIENPEEEDFQDAIAEILLNYDNEKKLNYSIIIF